MIFEIVSGDIHSGTDDECCRKVDLLAGVIARFVGRVNEEIEAKREIDEAAKLLHKEKSKPT